MDDLEWLRGNDPALKNEDESESVSPFWLLVEEYRVVDAVLLILGLEPQGLARDLEYNVFNEKTVPSGYHAAKAAVSSALNLGKIKGMQVLEEEEIYNEGIREIPGSVNVYRSTVNRDSLVEWLKSRNYTDCIWFPKEDDAKGFRDPNHSRYSAKLAAAVEAWEAFDEESNEPGRAKQRLAKWLRLNAARFGFTNDEGLPSETVVQDLAKVANWDTGGGAPKQSAPESDPD